jgi:hypothetical protein
MMQPEAVSTRLVAAVHRRILRQTETRLRLPNLLLKAHEVARLNRHSADLVPPICETEFPLPVA